MNFTSTSPRLPLNLTKTTLLSNNVAERAVGAVEDTGAEHALHKRQSLLQLVPSRKDGVAKRFLIDVDDIESDVALIAGVVIFGVCVVHPGSLTALVANGSTTVDMPGDDIKTEMLGLFFDVNCLNRNLLADNTMEV